MAETSDVFAAQMRALDTVNRAVTRRLEQRCDWSGRSVSCCPQCASCRLARDRRDDAGWTQCPGCGEWCETIVDSAGDVILMAHTIHLDPHDHGDLERRSA